MERAMPLNYSSAGTNPQPMSATTRMRAAIHAAIDSQFSSSADLRRICADVSACLQLVRGVAITMMKSLKQTIACGLVVILVTPALAQDSTPSKLAKREARLIYSRAYEATLWASPALAIMAQVEAGSRRWQYRHHLHQQVDGLSVGRDHLQ